jgi:hypothetical protein
MTHIDSSDAVAVKCQSSSTLEDPLHKNAHQYKELSDTLGWSREIETMLTSTNTRSALWDATEFSGLLRVSAASFVNRTSCVACITLDTIKNFTFKNHR